MLCYKIFSIRVCTGEIRFSKWPNHRYDLRETHRENKRKHGQIFNAEYRPPFSRMKSLGGVWHPPFANSL